MAVYFNKEEELEHRIELLEIAMGNVQLAMGKSDKKAKATLPINSVTNCAFDEPTLVAAWKALFGEDWKRNYRDNDRIREMKSIIDGGTMPCRPLKNWIKCIDTLRHCL